MSLKKLAVGRQDVFYLWPPSLSYLKKVIPEVTNFFFLSNMDDGNIFKKIVFNHNYLIYILIVFAP